LALATAKPSRLTPTAASIDYVLTVAVSTAAGIAALTSYFPGLEAQRVPLCLLAVFLVMLANLRGVSSSAKLLSLPTYLFLGMIFLLLVAGAFKTGQGLLPAIPVASQQALTASVWWCCPYS
jgi:amino acid transporter